MSRRVRVAVLVPSALGLAALFAWGFAGLPRFGHYQGPYGYVLNRIATPERHTTNVVTSTVFDYRGFDTLGEELILFAAVLGIVLLLRSQAGGEDEDEAEAEEAEQHEPFGTGSESLALVGTLMVGGAILVGLWLAAFGYVTPGGGFQGGVLVAGGALLVYLARGRSAFGPFGKEAVLDPIESAGAGGFVAVGLSALAAGLPFLHNMFGPGQTGTLFSGGSIPILNWAAAVEVAAANVVLFSEFLSEYIVPLTRKQR